MTNIFENAQKRYVSIGAKLLRQNHSITSYPKECDSKVGITASAQLMSGPGVLYGFIIVSHTAGATVRFSDALTATTPYVSSAITTVTDHKAGDFIPVGPEGVGMLMAIGSYVTITGTCEIIPVVRQD